MLRPVVRIACRPLLLAAVLLVAVLLAAAPAPAQEAARAHEEEAFSLALAAYQAAEFEEAAAAFGAIAEDEQAERPLRLDALRYLARTHTALGDSAAAAEDLRRLVALEPPIVELNPDVEPPTVIKTYYAVRRDMDGDYALRTERPRTLAIVNFTNNSITEHERYDPLQQGFASMMIHAMNGATDLRLVERERIRWLLEELQMQRDPALIDQSTAVRAGHLLGAHWVVFGAFMVNGRDLRIDARVVDVETGQILRAEQVRGRVSDLEDLVGELSLQTARALNVELAEGPEVETSSLDAALSYSEGLALVEQGDYSGAHAKFVQALEYDPGYGRARERVQSLQPLLAAR